MAPPGHTTYFRTHRAAPLSASQIRKGVGASAAQVQLVRATLEELGLTASQPKAAKRSASSARRAAKSHTRKTR